MESLISKQKRVRFHELQHVELNRNTESSLLAQIESFTGVLGDKVYNWFQGQYPNELVGQDDDPQDSEYAAAVAAAAFSIYSAQEAEANYRRKMREELQMSRTKLKSRKEDTILTRRNSRQDLKIGGETSARNFAEVDLDRRAQERAFLANRSPSSTSLSHKGMDQRKKAVPPRHRKILTKGEAWERAQMEKIVKRYEKIKAAVLAWENEKKLKARLKMEKQKGELEQRRALNKQHYEDKVARIERIAEGARVQAEQGRRNKEAEIKEKAKAIRTRGKAPAKY